MGLLDDAIREHLELKRLRGADPGAVAREERDALGPMLRVGRSDQGKDSEEASPDADRLTSTDVSSLGDDPSAAGQETVEINMEAELAAGTDPGREQEAASPKHAGLVDHPHPPASTEESLEWEIPDRRLDETSVGAGSGDSGAEDDEHVEDVLEETPDFLRDTPEQERLWFEQRPPRDFDFNE